MYLSLKKLPFGISIKGSFHLSADLEFMSATVIGPFL